MTMIFVISGCATPGYIPPKPVQHNMPGIYHRVERGQTLWRIAKTYNVSIEDITSINKLPDTAQISAGQLLFIPKRTPNVSVQIPSSFEMLEKSDFMWPVNGKILNFYGFKKDGVQNKGIDISVRESTDVAASRQGKVVFYEPRLKGYGQTIIIDHGDGFSTLYAHNSVSLVKAGDFVKQGQTIAKSGSTGRASAPCLHFQIRKGDKPQNPFYYLPR